MADERVPMTRVGYERLQEELKHLKFVDRHDIIAAIEEARSHGDLKENHYHTQAMKQSLKKQGLEVK